MCPHDRRHGVITGRRTPPFNLGNMFRATGRKIEAEVALRAATRADPTFAEAWYNLSDLLDEQGRSEAAIDCLRRALQAAPDYADAMSCAFVTARGGQPLHPRGNFEGFFQSASKQKWLEVHGIEHWTHYYTDSPDLIPRAGAVIFDHSRVPGGIKRSLEQDAKTISGDVKQDYLRCAFSGTGTPCWSGIQWPRSRSGRRGCVPARPCRHRAAASRPDSLAAVAPGSWGISSSSRRRSRGNHQTRCRRLRPLNIKLPPALAAVVANPPRRLRRRQTPRISVRRRTVKKREMRM